MNAVSDGSWGFHDYYDDSGDYAYWDDPWDLGLVLLLQWPFSPQGSVRQFRQ